MDPFSLLTGAAILTTGFLLGRFRPARRRAPEPVKPICGCGHHHAHHNPKTGTCGGMREVPSRYDGYGDPTAWQEVACTCQQYSGPQPIDTFYAPELT